MKILITGSTGFVGSHLSDLLQANGHELFSLARSREKFQLFNVKGKLLEGTIEVENSWIDQLPSDLDVVIHTAGVVHSYDPTHFYQSNSKLTKNLINCLKKKFEKLNFILISSQAAMGPTRKENTKEDDQPHPVSHYGISKLYSEHHLEKVAPTEWNKIIIRPPMVIGPRDPAILDVFKMVKSSFVFYQGKNGLKKEYSFVSVFDLIKFISIMSEKEYSSPSLEKYFVANPKPILFKELISEIKTNIGISNTFNIRVPLFIMQVIAFGLQAFERFLPTDLRLTPDKLAEVIPSKWVCDSTKSLKGNNFTYKWDLKRILKETSDYYQNEKWL